MSTVIFKINVNGYADEYKDIQPFSNIEQYPYKLKIIKKKDLYEVLCYFYRDVYNCGLYYTKNDAYDALKYYMKEAMMGRIHNQPKHMTPNRDLKATLLCDRENKKDDIFSFWNPLLNDNI